MLRTEPDTSLFAELYDVQPQAIVWMRPVQGKNPDDIIDFEYAYANEEGLKFLKLTREAFSGLKLSVSRTVNEEVRKFLFDSLLEAYNSGIKSEKKIYNPVLKKHARVYFTRLREGVLVLVQDISYELAIIHQLEDQKQKLQDQQALLNSILDNSSNGISVSRVFRNEEGRIIDAQTIMANDAAVKYIGLPKEDYLTKTAQELEPGVLDSPYYHACVKTLETGEPFVMQYFMESTRRWLELTVSKMDNDHLIQIFTDVSVVKEAQLTIENAANTLRTVFDAAQTGMFTFEPIYNEANEIIDFRFVMVNSTVTAFSGKTREELEGAPGIQWFPDYITNGEFEVYKTCYLSGEPQRKEIHYHLDGRELFIDLQCVKINDQLLVTLTDHSSLRKSQLELEQTVHALERSNKLLEDFAHAASHDLKEPLRKIRTLSTRLKATLANRLTEEENNLFNRIEVAAERMQLLVDDLLEFSQVSQNQVQTEEVDLNEKIERILADLELQIEEKAARVMTDPLPTVTGNRRQLQQLFQNLLSNALKYSKPGVPPVIAIRSKTVEPGELPSFVPLENTGREYYLFEIRDNGIGFEQEYAEQIFKMFQRLHGRSEYSGTGVGLSIARKVVENHKGYIWAEGIPGEGAVFYVVLPK